MNRFAKDVAVVDEQLPVTSYDLNLVSTDRKSPLLTVRRSSLSWSALSSW